LANLSGILGQLKKERDRVQHHLTGLTPLLRHSRQSTEETPEPNLPANCQQRDAPASRQLRERDGRKLRDSKRLFQLRSRSEQCQHRLVARSQKLNGRGGQCQTGEESCVTKDRLLNGTYQRSGNRPPGEATLRALSVSSANSAWAYFRMGMSGADPFSLYCRNH
jgi:hypothetical protein